MFLPKAPIKPNLSAFSPTFPIKFLLTISPEFHESYEPIFY